MNTPLISVIIPVFNGEDVIGKCLRSVLDQTYTNYEVLVIDNNSTDGTARIIKNFQGRDKMIKYLFEEKRGVGRARNSGIDNAGGEILCFTDSDCIVPRDWIERLTEKIRNDEEKVVAGFEYDLVGNYWTKNIEIDDWSYMTQNIEGNYVQFIDGKNFAIETNLAREVMFDANIRMSDDLEFSLRLSKNSKIFFDSSVRVGHFHKSSAKKQFKTLFERAYYYIKITRRHKKIELNPFEGIVYFIPHYTKKLLNKHERAYYELVSESALRLGYIWGKII